MKESGALDSLPFPCQQMATTRHDLTVLAAGCWLLAVGHCQRAKNHARKSRWRELRKLMIFGASALPKKGKEGKRLGDWRIGGYRGGHFFVPTLSGVTPFASNPALAMAISMFFLASCIES